jgi:hypothetical protein
MLAINVGFLETCDEYQFEYSIQRNCQWWGLLCPYIWQTKGIVRANIYQVILNCLAHALHCWWRMYLGDSETPRVLNDLCKCYSSNDNSFLLQ